MPRERRSRFPVPGYCVGGRYPCTSTAEAPFRLRVTLEAFCSTRVPPAPPPSRPGSTGHTQALPRPSFHFLLHDLPEWSLAPSHSFCFSTEDRGRHTQDRASAAAYGSWVHVTRRVMNQLYQPEWGSLPREYTPKDTARGRRKNPPRSRAASRSISSASAARSGLLEGTRDAESAWVGAAPPEVHAAPEREELEEQAKHAVQWSRRDVRGEGARTASVRHRGIKR